MSRFVMLQYCNISGVWGRGGLHHIMSRHCPKCPQEERFVSRPRHLPCSCACLLFSFGLTSFMLVYCIFRTINHVVSCPFNFIHLYTVIMNTVVIFTTPLKRVRNQTSPHHVELPLCCWCPESPSSLVTTNMRSLQYPQPCLRFFRLRCVCEFDAKFCRQNSCNQNGLIQSPARWVTKSGQQYVARLTKGRVFFGTAST